jgi:anti-sigma regulatory factor (Ser/Thr protein kinase)
LTWCAELRGDVPPRSGPRKACVLVRRRSHVLEVRRRADAFAREMGFDLQDRGRVSIQVTEAATNLLHHAVAGEVFLSAVERGSRRSLEMLALDHGPGIADPGRALAGGASSRGSLGEGLGAIHRLADDFELETSPRGTAVFARSWARLPATGRGGASEDRDPETPCSAGALCRPKPGQIACGDAWAVRGRADGSRLAVLADGLGHGPDAAEAAEAVVRVVARASKSSPGELLELAHEALRATRGAAVAMARVDDWGGRLTFAGVGNVAGTVVAGGKRKGLVSLNGTVGCGALQVQELEEEWPPGALLVLQTDGVALTWDLARYPGLTRRDPSMVAGILYRDGAVQRDDASVLVLRRQGPPSSEP